jgi:hypothetical protein
LLLHTRLKLAHALLVHLLLMLYALISLLVRSDELCLELLHLHAPHAQLVFERLDTDVVCLYHFVQALLNLSLRYFKLVRVVSQTHVLLLALLLLALVLRELRFEIVTPGYKVFKFLACL